MEIHRFKVFKAGVAKLVDALALGASGATLESSSLSARTQKIAEITAIFLFFLTKCDLLLIIKLAKI